jgi:nitrate reductase (NAD(P)H)
MLSTQHRIKIKCHPGSSQADIEKEPDWERGYQNRIGYRNRQDRFPGLTHQGDEKGEEKDFERDAIEQIDQLHGRVSKGALVNFRDIIIQQKASGSINAACLLGSVNVFNE